MGSWTVALAARDPPVSRPRVGSWRQRQRGAALRPRGDRGRRVVAVAYSPHGAPGPAPSGVESAGPGADVGPVRPGLRSGGVVRDRLRRSARDHLRALVAESTGD